MGFDQASIAWRIRGGPFQRAHTGHVGSVEMASSFQEQKVAPTVEGSVSGVPTSTGPRGALRYMRTARNLMLHHFNVCMYA